MTFCSIIFQFDSSSEDKIGTQSLISFINREAAFPEGEDDKALGCSASCYPAHKGEMIALHRYARKWLPLPWEDVLRTYGSISLSLDTFQDPSGCLKPDATLYIFCVFPYTHRHVRLKKALHSFSLAFLNFQHCYACTSGPLLSKIRVTWAQALSHFHSWSKNPDGW